MKKLFYLFIMLTVIVFTANSQETIKTYKLELDCTLKQNAGPLNPIMDIMAGEEINVIGYERGYFKVSYKDTIGYLNEVFIDDHELGDIAKKWNIEKRVDDLIEKYGTARTRLIINNEVCLGMSSEEATESWGRPSEINKSTYVFGIHEQWVYSKVGAKTRYLYFEDGVLTSIQE